MRVLLIEDEIDLCQVLEKALEEEGYSVDIATDGEEGLHQARGVSYDAILLDLMLPGIDGWTILERLREEKSTPVLILTARDGVSERVRGLDGGADDYLTKPFELSELLARLRALIRRSKAHPSPVLKVGALEIDTNARTVRKDGELVILTAKEYSLLELLALHPNQIVSRSMIYDHIYDDTSDTLSNVVDVYISTLRKKLGKDFVRTRRGEGYIVDA